MRPLADLLGMTARSRPCESVRGRRDHDRLDHLRNSLLAQADAVVAIGGGAGTLTEIGLAWIYRRLIVALRVDGWSGELADRRIDERIRYANIADDRVFGASDAVEAADIVTARIGAYVCRHTGIRSRNLA
jgi:SLOG cluster4 family